MSRIYQHKQHQKNKRIMIYLLLVIVAMLILFKLGFTTLINSAVLVSSLGKEIQEVDGISDKAFHGFLQLEEPLTATNEARIALTGSVQEYHVLEFYVNEQKVKEEQVHDVTFSTIVDELIAGENTVYVKAVSKDRKQSATSDTYTVMYASEPPEITIDSPANGETIRSQDVRISGSTKPGATLRINGKPAVVSFTGAFTVLHTLKEGENILEFVATDIAGNSTTSELLLKFEKQ